MSTHHTNGKRNIILVTAATAPVGRSIVEQLVTMGHPVRALTQDEHVNKVYHLTGPASLTHQKQVQLIGKALGRPLRYEEMDEKQARAAISPYAPADVLFRALQGLGAGMGMALVATVFGDLFEPEARAKWGSVFGIVYGVSNLFGPTLGGCSR